MEELRLAGRAFRVHEVEEEEGGDGARVLPGQRDAGGVAAEGKNVALRREITVVESAAFSTISTRMINDPDGPRCCAACLNPLESLLLV